MKPVEKIVYKTKEATFLATIIDMFREEIKNPMLIALAPSLGSLVKAVDASGTLRSVFVRIFTYIKENWNGE